MKPKLLLPAVLMLLAVFSNRANAADNGITPTTSTETRTTATWSAKTDLSPVPLPEETLTSYTAVPDVRVLIQQRRQMQSNAPIRVVVYTLPNGNTIEQTYGRVEEPGQDWHYQIQHIAAQTRRVQELIPQENFVTVYLQAVERSWPSWRLKHPDSSASIRKLVDSLHEKYGTTSTVDLVSHSGGGSFIFGFLNGGEQVPEYIRRIVFLDSNYAFEAADGHARKLLEWINKSTEHRLLVMCYDDRSIILNDKPIVSPTGGTFRSTSRMSAAFEASLTLTPGTYHDFITTTSLDGRLELRAHVNPEGKILHTVLVEKNGFIYALTLGTPAYKVSAPEDFYGEQRYRSWIR